MAKTVFLTLEQVLAIHFDQVERYGGSHGVRDLALLESAVQRPQASFMGEDLYDTVFAKAAALFHSLALNHPFIDGNKRSSVVATAYFLHVNGWELETDQKELLNAALAVATKAWDIEQITKWLEAYCRNSVSKA